jgi:6-phosphogluconate dehydrogenase
LLRASGVVDNVPGAFKAWSRGTVVRSWLLDLLVEALEADPELSQLAGFVEDSGEGRWTVEQAIAHAVPAPVITAALFARFASRQDDSPGMKAVAALRQQFGGHAVKPAD